MQVNYSKTSKIVTDTIDETVPIDNNDNNLIKRNTVDIKIITFKVSRNLREVVLKSEVGGAG